MISDEQIQSYIDDGKYWRAREVLQGRLTNAGYDVDLFERLGNVLLQMHDLLTAGRYLFLSGVRKPEYEEAIAIYLSRYAKPGAAHLWASMPKSARKARIDAWPKIMVDELVSLGYQTPDFDYITDSMPPHRASDKGSSIAGNIGAVVMVLLLVGLVASAIHGLYWLGAAIFG